VPFREAHEVVGALVARCISGGKTFAMLTDAEWAEAHPVFADQRPPLDGAGSVALRDVPGGTAPVRVDVARTELESLAAAQAEWVTTQRTKIDNVFMRPENAGAKI
jgi:argininosuccinate lyase